VPTRHWPTRRPADRREHLAVSTDRFHAQPPGSVTPAAASATAASGSEYENNDECDDNGGGHDPNRHPPGLCGHVLIHLHSAAETGRMSRQTARALWRLMTNRYPCVLPAIALVPSRAWAARIFFAIVLIIEAVVFGVRQVNSLGI
jgi:hypothetical protein